MKLKQSKWIQIDFESKWARNGLLLMAASLFLMVVYYFGLVNMADLGFLQVVFAVVLPLLLTIGYLLFMHFLKWNAPMICGLAGAAFCVLLAVNSLFYGDFLRIVLSAVGYAIAAGVLVLHVSGSLRNTSLCVAVFVIPAIVRVVLFDLGRIGIAEMFREGSALCLLGALACIPLMLKYTKRR